MTGVPRNFVILFTPRCGSTLLSADLSRNKLGIVYEMFHNLSHVFLKDDNSLLRRDLDWNEYQEAMDAYRINGIFGTKINYTSAISLDAYISRGRPLGAGLVEVFGKEAVVICMYRADVVGQALSLYEASATGKWSEEAPTEDELAALYDMEPEDLWWIIQARVNEISRENLYIEMLVRAAGFSNVTKIRHEDHIFDREGSIAGVAGMLGVAVNDVVLSSRAKARNSKRTLLHRAFTRAALSPVYRDFVIDNRVPKSFVDEVRDDYGNRL